MIEQSTADVRMVQVVEELRGLVHNEAAYSLTCAQALRQVDAYLRSICPDLPEHYGMPVDGVRFVIERLRAA